MMCTCVRCGKQFEAKRKTAVCADCHTAVCVVCGKEFQLQTPWTQKTCSLECRVQYVKSSGISKQQGDKAVQTKVSRYGSKSGPAKTYVKTCKFCGKEFTTTSTRQVYCPGPHHGPCPNCGQPTVIKDISIGPQACCEKCRQELIKKTTLEKYGAEYIFQTDYQKEKSKQTMLEKYGAEHYLQSDEGKARFRQMMLENYGVENYLQSDEGKNKVRNTNIQKYGVPVPTMNEEVKSKAKETAERNFGGVGFGSSVLSERIRATNLDKYGTENPMQNSEIKKKAEDTLIQKYGEHPLQSKEIIEKRVATSMKQYGVPVPSMSDEIQKKMQETSMLRYGVKNPFQSEEVKSKIAESNIERYGVPNPMQSEEIQDKAKATCLAKYGSTSFMSSVEGAKLSIVDPSKAEIFVEFKKDPESFILEHFDFKPTLKQLSEMVGSTDSTVLFYIVKRNLKHLIEYKKSTIEVEMLQFLKQYVDESRIIPNDHQVIKPKELDYYLPDYKIGIECNPAYTHNSSIHAYHPDSEIIPREYHKKKTIMCEDKGVRLIHVFGYQWSFHKDVVESMILNALGKTPIVYYARKLELKEVSNSDSRKFLDDNHIQGYTSSKVRLGLYQGDELVCLMIFSRKRGTIGHTSEDTQDDWELTRFCNKTFSRCVGGASKLFKYFIDTYHPNTVVSFSDRSNTSGNLYDALGFEFSSYVEPGYVWADPNTEMCYNRVKCQKSNLRKLFNDDTIDIEHQTESQIMEAHGFVKVYNSGLIKWTWRS